MGIDGNRIIPAAVGLQLLRLLLGMSDDVTGKASAFVVLKSRLTGDEAAAPAAKRTSGLVRKVPDHQNQKRIGFMRTRFKPVWQDRAVAAPTVKAERAYINVDEFQPPGKSSLFDQPDKRLSFVTAGSFVLGHAIELNKKARTQGFIW
jgi:hypothetical protein